MIATACASPALIGSGGAYDAPENTCTEILCSFVYGKKDYRKAGRLRGGTMPRERQVTQKDLSRAKKSETDQWISLQNPITVTPPAGELVFSRTG